MPRRFIASFPPFFYQDASLLRTMNETHTTILPHAAEAVHFHWRSTSFAAKFYGRTRERIVQWCKTGRFASVNIPVYQDASHRWWVAVPLDDNDLPFE